MVWMGGGGAPTPPPPPTLPPPPQALLRIFLFYHILKYIKKVQKIYVVLRKNIQFRTYKNQGFKNL
jgi:MoxR-like ATPase